MLKYFISQNVARPSNYNVAYYLGPYFSDNFKTNYLDGEVVAPSAEGFYLGIDFVESPTDIDSLIITYRNSSDTSTIGVGASYGTSAITIDSNDDYSYLFIIPQSFSNFYDSSFNLNPDTIIEILYGGTSYTYKFEPSYNGRLKSSESYIYFSNFPYPNNYGQYLESIMLEMTFGQTFSSSSYNTVYPYDNQSVFYDGSLDLFTNRPTDTGISKDDTKFSVTLTMGNYPLVFDVIDIELSINQLDAYGNVVTSNSFTSAVPSRLPAEWTLTNAETVSSRIQVTGTLNISLATYLLYSPIYKASVEYSGDYDIQIYNGGEMLWSYMSTHGQLWTPTESPLTSDGYHTEDEISNVLIEFNHLYTLEGADWEFRLIDSNTDEIVSTCDFTVSYASSDSQPEIIFE